MKGVLLLTNELNHEDKMCECAVTCYDFGLCLYIDDEYTLEKQLENQNLIIDGLKDGIKTSLFGKNYDCADRYKKLIDNIDNFYNYVEYIAFTYDVDIIKFMNIAENTRDFSHEMNRTANIDNYFRKYLQIIKKRSIEKVN